MKGPNKQISQIINPYRQNRRSFSKYYNNSNHLNLSLSKNSAQRKPGDFLDGVSRASSIKLIQNPFELEEKVIKILQKQQKQNRCFVVSNKRKIQQFQNPQIYHMISKHVEINQTQKKKSKNQIITNVDYSLSSRFKSKSFSIDQFKITPKITQFSRQTFYRNTSTSRDNYWSKKQKQDNLHSSSNLDINSKKISLCKKTLPWKQKHSFVTYEVYIINKRIGVEAAILAGTSKQIKFRLIINQSDTKTFHKYWKANIQQFMQKCLTLSEDGIGLKLGSFNIQKNSKAQLSRVKQNRKNYLENYESFLQKQIKPKSNTIRVGNIVFSSEYSSEEKKINPLVQILNSNKEEVKSDDQEQLQIKKQREHILQIKPKDQNKLGNQTIQIPTQQIQLQNISSLKQIIEEKCTINRKEQSHQLQVQQKVKLKSN